MSHRTYTDSHGTPWEVWDTVPDASRRMVQPDYAEGWLTFQCEREKRRLVPIPAGWAVASVGELETMRARAVVVPAVRPRSPD